MLDRRLAPQAMDDCHFQSAWASCSLCPQTCAAGPAVMPPASVLAQTRARAQARAHGTDAGAHGARRRGRSCRRLRVQRERRRRQRAGEPRAACTLSCDARALLACCRASLSVGCACPACTLALAGVRSRHDPVRRCAGGQQRRGRRHAPGATDRAARGGAAGRALHRRPNAQRRAGAGSAAG